MCVVDGKLRVNAMLRDVLVDGKKTPILSKGSVALQEEYWAMFAMLRQMVLAYAEYGDLSPAKVLNALIPPEGSCKCVS